MGTNLKTNSSSIFYGHKTLIFDATMTSLAVYWNDESDLLVRSVKTEGIVLLFCINEHCLEKYSLKSLLFSLKLYINLLLL